MKFKFQVLGYLRDLYDFRRCRYSDPKSLAEDVMRLAKDRLVSFQFKYFLSLDALKIWKKTVSAFSKTLFNRKKR